MYLSQKFLVYNKVPSLEIKIISFYSTRCVCLTAHVESDVNLHQKRKIHCTTFSKTQNSRTLRPRLRLLLDLRPFVIIYLGSVKKVLLITINLNIFLSLIKHNSVIQCEYEKCTTTYLFTMHPCLQ